MSFMDIEDPLKRDEIFKDYIVTIKKIQQRNEDEKLGNLTRRRDLEEQWEPVVKSQEKFTDLFSKQLVPIKEEVLNIQQTLGRQSLGKPRTILEFEDLGPEAERFISRNKVHDPTLDRTFGIRFTADGQLVIGNTPITIQGDDIVIGKEVYHGSRGLWSLITDTQKDQIVGANPTPDDENEYASMMYQTSVLHENSNPKSNMPRSNKSWKWKQILTPIWEKIKKMDGNSSEGEGLVPAGFRLFLRKNGHCCQVQKMGKGLYLEPHHDLSVEGDGLYLQAVPSSNFYDGSGIQEPLLNILK